MPGFVSPPTMNVVVNAIDRHYRTLTFAGLPLVSNADLQRVGALLYGLNADALAARCKDGSGRERAPAFVFRPILHTLEPEHALTCLENLIFACSVQKIMKAELYTALVNFSVKLALEAARARMPKSRPMPAQRAGSAR